MKEALTMDGRIAIALMLLFVIVIPLTLHFYLLIPCLCFVLIFAIRGIHELESATDAVILKFWNTYQVIYGPGTYVSFPWYNQKITYSIGVVPYQTPYFHTTDRNGKKLILSILLELKIKDPLVCNQFRLEQMNVLIDSIIEKLLCTQLPKYQFEDFIEMKSDLMSIVNARIGVTNLLVHDLFITQLR